MWKYIPFTDDLGSKWRKGLKSGSMYLNTFPGSPPNVTNFFSRNEQLQHVDIFRFLRSVLSLNDVTGNYLWVAPLKLDLFPYILRPFTLPPPHVLYKLSGSWFNWSLWQKTKVWQNSFILRSREWFLWCRYKEGSSGGAPCLSSIFTVLAGAQKWQLWSPDSQFTTP